MNIPDVIRGRLRAWEKALVGQAATPILVLGYSERTAQLIVTTAEDIDDEETRELLEAALALLWVQERTKRERRPSPSNEDLMARFTTELETLDQAKPVTLELPASLTWILVGQLQLALRHPANRGASAKLTRDFVENLGRLIAPGGALREVFNRGWDPTYDEEVSHGDPGAPDHLGPAAGPRPDAALLQEAQQPTEDPRADRP